MNKKQVTYNVGEVIKINRIKKGLTQQELANGICSAQHIYRIESSKRLPSAYLINLLSIKLGKNLIKDIYSDNCEWTFK